MSAFDAALAHVLKHEGGYVNDSHDPGGETNFGISKRFHPNEDIKNMTRERAGQIYKAEYWNQIGADHLHAPLALMAFDGAVNQGVSRMNGWLAQTDSVDELAALRGMRYASRPTFDRYGHGWMRRLMDTHRAAIALEHTGV